MNNRTNTDWDILHEKWQERAREGSTDTSSAVLKQLLQYVGVKKGAETKVKTGPPSPLGIINKQMRSWIATIQMSLVRWWGAPSSVAAPPHQDSTEVVQASGHDVSLWRFFTHFLLEGDHNAGPELNGGIIHPLWTGNALISSWRIYYFCDPMMNKWKEASLLWVTCLCNSSRCVLAPSLINSRLYHKIKQQDGGTNQFIFKLFRPFKKQR